MPNYKISGVSSFPGLLRIYSKNSSIGYTYLSIGAYSVVFSMDVLDTIEVTLEKSDGHCISYGKITPILTTDPVTVCERNRGVFPIERNILDTTLISDLIVKQDSFFSEYPFTGNDNNVLGWNDITYGNNIFVMVGGNTGTGNGTNKVYYSTDGGTNWSYSTLPGIGKWNSVVYGDGVFVAIPYSINNASTTMLAISTDNCVTWTSKTFTNTNYWANVIYNNGKFFALPSSAGTYINVSSNGGNTWNSVTIPVNSIKYKIVGDGNNNLAICVNGGYCFYSNNNGENWSQATLPKSSPWEIAYGNGFYFLIPSSSSSSNYFYKSINCINWEPVLLPIHSYYVRRMVYVDNMFIMIPFGTTSNYLIVSLDGGSTWRTVYFNNPLQNTLTGFACDGTKTLGVFKPKHLAIINKQAKELCYL